MISHLKQYIIDRMTCSYKFGCIFLLCTVRCIFFYINVISTLIGLTYKNLEKMANKIFNVPNHLNKGFNCYFTIGLILQRSMNIKDL